MLAGAAAPAWVELRDHQAALGRDLGELEAARLPHRDAAGAAEELGEHRPASFTHRLDRDLGRGEGFGGDAKVCHFVAF